MLKNLQFLLGVEMSVRADMDALLSDLEIGETFFITVPGPGYEFGFEYALYRDMLPPGLDVTDGMYWTFPATGFEESREELVSSLVKIVLTVLNLAIAHECGKVLRFERAMGQSVQLLPELTMAIQRMVEYNEAQQPSRWSSMLNADRSAQLLTPEARASALQQLNELLRLDFRVEKLRIA